MRRYALVGVHPNVRVRADNGGDRYRGTKVCERLDRPAVPRGSETKRPDEVRDEEDDRGLVETVEHVHPELELRVLESTDTANVELGEREGGLGVEILVKRCDQILAASL